MNPTNSRSAALFSPHERCLPPSYPTPAAFPIVLIGVKFEENLSLRYLAGALLAAGYAATRVQPYNSVLDAEAICEAIVAENPALVGISMVFQARAIEDLTLIELLRSDFP